MDTFGTEFVKKRGVVVDSYLWDDGCVALALAAGTRPSPRAAR